MSKPFFVFLAAGGVIVVLVIFTGNRLVSLTQRSPASIRLAGFFRIPARADELDRRKERQAPTVSLGS